MYFEQKFSVNPSNLKMTRSDYDYEMIENCLSIDNPSSSQTLIKLDTPRRSKRFRDALSTLPVQANYQQKVSRRNERERNRVQLINKEFEKLADLVYNINLTEVSTRNLALNDKENVRQQQSDAKRRRQFSKLNTLRNAIGYIKNLQCELLNSDPSQQNSFDFNSKEVNNAWLKKN